VLLRKYGQEIIRITAGKRVHGTGAIPGGVNKSLSVNERQFLLKDVDQIIQWSSAALAIAKKIFFDNIDANRTFATVATNMLSIIAKNGALDLYDGGLRAKAINGQTIFDHIQTSRYEEFIHEQIKSWSYMKFPYIRSLGHSNGSYRVGPLARLNNCEFIPTPLAEAERVYFRQFADNGLVQSTLAYHWARMIELLFCAESIKDLLNDPDIIGRDLKREGELQSQGIGVIEAPRGTLFHHYQIDEDGLVTKANLIVSTTNNNHAMNQSIRKVANDIFDGRELSEPLLNQIEVAIRAYDPCLSCATHALGKMPLRIELVNPQGELIDTLLKQSNGHISK
jgi:NAD-reducing hydrogenase large subunit